MGTKMSAKTPVVETAVKKLRTRLRTEEGFGRIQFTIEVIRLARALEEHCVAMAIVAHHTTPARIAYEAWKREQLGK